MAFLLLCPAICVVWHEMLGFQYHSMDLTGSERVQSLDMIYKLCLLNQISVVPSKLEGPYSAMGPHVDCFRVFLPYIVTAPVRAAT